MLKKTFLFYTSFCVNQSKYLWWTGFEKTTRSVVLRKKPAASSAAANIQLRLIHRKLSYSSFLQVCLHHQSRLTLLSVCAVGEPINTEAWEWYHKVVGDGRCPVVDTWWQTGRRHSHLIFTEMKRRLGRFPPRSS